MFLRTFLNVCKMSSESFNRNVKSSSSSELVRRLSDSNSSRSRNDPGQTCYEVSEHETILSTSFLQILLPPAYLLVKFDLFKLAYTVELPS